MNQKSILLVAGLLLLLPMLTSAEANSKQKNKGQQGTGTNTGVDPCLLDENSPIVEISAQDLMRRFAQKDTSVYCTRWRVVINQYSELHFFGKLLANIYLFSAMQAGGDSRIDKVSTERMITWFKLCVWEVLPEKYIKLRERMELLQAKLEVYERINGIPLGYRTRSGMMKHFMKSGFYNNAEHDAIIAELKGLQSIEQAYQRQYYGFPLWKGWEATIRRYSGDFVGAGEEWNTTLGRQGWGRYTYTDKTHVYWPKTTFGNMRNHMGLDMRRLRWILQAFHPDAFCESFVANKPTQPNTESQDNHLYCTWGSAGKPPPWITGVRYSDSVVQRQDGTFHKPVADQDAYPGSPVYATLDRMEKKGWEAYGWRIYREWGKLFLHEYAVARFLQMFYLRGVNFQGGEQAAKDLLGVGEAALGMMGMAISGASSPVGWISAGIGMLGKIITAILNREGLKSLERAAWKAASDEAKKALARFGLSMADLPGWKYDLNYPHIRVSGSVRENVIEDAWQYFYNVDSVQIPQLYLHLDFDFPQATAYGFGHVDYYAFRVITKNTVPTWDYGKRVKPRM